MGVIVERFKLTWVSVGSEWVDVDDGITGLGDPTSLIFPDKPLNIEQAVNSKEKPRIRKCLKMSLRENLPCIVIRMIKLWIDRFYY